MEHKLALSDRARFARRSRATLYTSKLEGRKGKEEKTKEEKGKKAGKKRKGKEKKRKGEERKKKGVRKIKTYDLQFILLVSSSYAHLQIGIPI